MSIQMIKKYRITSTTARLALALHKMTEIDIEANWLQTLSKDAQILFLAGLGHGITIAARNSYAAGGNDVVNPIQLRQIAEIQHRVLGCLLHLLRDNAHADIYHSVANCVLNQSEAELQGLMFHTWHENRKLF